MNRTRKAFNNARRNLNCKSHLGFIQRSLCPSESWITITACPLTQELATRVRGRRRSATSTTSGSASLSSSNRCSSTCQGDALKMMSHARLKYVISFPKLPQNHIIVINKWLSIHPPTHSKLKPTHRLQRTNWFLLAGEERFSVGFRFGVYFSIKKMFQSKELIK
jgi:hypothetical protein